jgi:hypothetical protein
MIQLFGVKFKNCFRWCLVLQRLFSVWGESETCSTFNGKPKVETQTSFYLRSKKEIKKKISIRQGCYEGTSLLQNRSH